MGWVWGALLVVVVLVVLVRLGTPTTPPPRPSGPRASDDRAEVTSAAGTTGAAEATGAGAATGVAAAAAAVTGAAGAVTGSPPLSAFEQEWRDPDGAFVDGYLVGRWTAQERQEDRARAEVVPDSDEDEAVVAEDDRWPGTGASDMSGDDVSDDHWGQDGADDWDEF